MKKFSILLLVLFAIGGELKAQYISVSAFGGYTFQDKLNFSDAYALIHAGGIWGVSAEGISHHGEALEVLYQYQSTSIPVYKYGVGGNSDLLNPNDNTGVISYLLINGNKYFPVSPAIEPYFGIGAGIAFISADAGSSGSNFAWDLKTGLKIHTSNKKVSFKIGAQLLSSLHQSGTYYYGPYYVYSAYTSALQFSFTGGITFDFGH